MTSNQDIFLSFLSEQRQFFRSVFEAINDLVLVIDQLGNVCQVNRKSCEQMELDYEQIRSSNCLDVLQFENKKFESVEHLLKQCASGKVRCWLRLNEALIIPVLLSGSDLVDKQDNQMGAVLSLRDLREEYELQSKIIHLETWRSLGQMAAGIAHEINNPLAILKGYTGLIADIVEQKEGYRKEDLLESVQKIGFTVDRIAQIVSGMRALTGEYNVESRTPVHVKEVVEEVILPFRERCMHLGIDLEFNLLNGQADHLHEERLELWSLSGEVKQILVSLISNSIEALTDANDTGAKKISMSVESEGSTVRFRVSDSGPGVGPKAVGSIFYPFFTTKFEQKSIGLGLSVARGMAEQLGGSLKYEGSPSSGGAVFVLELPAEVQVAA